MLHILALIWAAHHTAITIVTAWVYSALMSSQPALSATAGYYTRWVHDFAQALAANVGKIQR